MKNKIVAALGSAALIASFSANAQWTGSAGYTHVSVDSTGVGAAYGSVGYRFSMQDNFYFVPEFRAGVGVVDDTLDSASEYVPGYGWVTMDVDAEIEQFYGFSARFHYEFQGGTYLFAAPSYTNFKLKVSASYQGLEVSYSESDWELGIGAGIGYMFNDRMGAELSYENIDSADVVSLGLRFRF